MYRNAFRVLKLSILPGVALFLSWNAAFAAPVQATKDVQYVAGGSPSEKLDLYIPKSGSGPFPVVVWIHGGGWLLGDKSANPPVDDVSDRGWALVSINHRTPVEAKYPAQLHDCKAAIRFLRANAKQYKLDPNRIAIWGESSGGHLGLLLGTTGNIKELEGEVGGNREYSSAVQGVVNWGGPSDLSTIDQQAQTPGAKFISSRGGQVTALLGAYAPENQALAKDASPVTYASSQNSPMLLVHGRNDEIIPTQQSINAAQRFRLAGAPVQLHVVPTMHDVNNAANRKMALDFFSSCFGGHAMSLGAQSNTLPANSVAGSLAPSPTIPTLSAPGTLTGELFSNPVVQRHARKFERILNQVTGAGSPTTQSNQLIQLLNSKTKGLDSKAFQWIDKQLK